MHAPVKSDREQKSTDRPPGLLSGAYAKLKRHRLCIITVIIPTLLSVVYYGAIASDIYISQSSFVVRSPNLQSTGGLNSILQGAGLSGFSEATDDAYTVESYMLSRDALINLDQQLGLRAAWSSDKVDFLHRFGLWGFRNNFEYLYIYYQNRINVDLDSHSNLITLNVSTFSPDEAQQINELLLKEAESLVNKLNDRARHDLIGYAMAQVDEAKKAVTDASLALSDYRNQEGVVDPEKQSAVNFNLIATKTELANLRAFAPNSPNPPTLELRAQTLQSAIDSEMAKVAGGKDSLSSKDAKYEELALERGFAQQQLSMDLTSLQLAQDNAQRQQLYLEIVANPLRPDTAIEPRRIEGVLVTLLVGLIAWGIASMLLAGIQEHQL